MENNIPRKEAALIKSGPAVNVHPGIKSIDELFESEIIGEFVKNSGQYVILPKGTNILNKIYDYLQEYLVRPMRFREIVLPKIIPVETVRKADILGKWDQYLIVARPFSKTKGVEEDYILDPLQCTAFYQFMESKTVDVSEGALKVYDRSGPTYRNEDKDKIVPCIKQREFHRAEFVYVGSREQVIETREKCLAQLEKLCNDLGLKYRIVVGSGCYQLRDGEIKYPETLEEIPIKDLEIWCPGYVNPSYKDNPDEMSFLEVVGSSVLAQTQTSRFNIRGKNDDFLWSGCTGIGLDRFIYALVSNYGPNFSGES